MLLKIVLYMLAIYLRSPKDFSRNAHISKFIVYAIISLKQFINFSTLRLHYSRTILAKVSYIYKINYTFYKNLQYPISRVALRRCQRFSIYLLAVRYLTIKAPS